MKRLIVPILLSISLLILVTELQSQTYRGKSEFRIKKSFAEIVAYDQLLPEVRTQGRQIKNEINEYPELPIDLSEVISIAPNAGSAAIRLKDPSPAPDKDFLGLDDSGGSIPPDVNGAVGPNHLMVTLNTDFRILDRDGNVIHTVGSGAFWHPHPGAGGVFDPKISYDPYENRWILIEPSSSDPATTRLMVAVSETDDPTGNWFFYSFDGDPENTHWFDYPNYGFNKRWIVATGNLFGPDGVYVAIYVLNKMDLYNHAFDVEYVRIKEYNGFTIVPAVTYDPEEEDIYMVNNAGGNNNGSGYLKLWKVTGETADPQVESIGLVQIQNPWSNGSYANAGNFLPQLGSDEKINSVDARMENMVYRNGKLWTTHHVYLPANNPTRTAVQWFELTPEGTVNQWGRVDDPAGGMFFAFATIAVNAMEDVMVGFGSFSEQQYASGSYAVRFSDDPPGMMRDYYQFKDGLAPYFKTFGAERNRWGDYTATWVDPVDDLDFWTIQEYAELPQSQDEWGTWWAYLDLDAIPEARFSANIETVPVGSSVNFTDQSKYTPTSWKWIFEGGSPEISTDQNPQHILYNHEGLYKVTLIAMNELGSDTLELDHFIEASTTILPAVDFTVTDTVPCFGETVIFEDLTVYNPNSWLWEFSPNLVTFVNGTDASSQHPQVIFEYPFEYTVTLTATNNNGNSSLMKPMLVKAGGQPLPFHEDFESRSFSRQSWSLENPDSKKTWEIISVGGSEGMYAAYVNIKAYIGYEERDRLISPPLSFYGFKNINLAFRFAYAQRYAEYTDSLIVAISTDCGMSWTRLLALAEDGMNSFATHVPTSLNFIPESEEDWCGAPNNPACVNLDLSAYSGLSNVRLLFETYNGYGNNIFLDDITLDGDINAVEVNPASEPGILVFPNPSAGKVTFEWPDMGGPASVEIVNSTGQTVLLDQLNDPGKFYRKEYDLGNTGKGIYFIRIKQLEHTLIKKVVVW